VTSRFVTEETLRDAIGDVQVDPEAFGDILEDAQKVYDIAQADPWLTDTSLRTEAQNAGLDPDRVNVALEVLKAGGRLFAVNLTEKQIPQEEPDA
jgi:hypothetical protein